MTARVPLGEVIHAAGGRAGPGVDLPVYSVTKHSGFVPSLEYFRKQVFSRDVKGYKVVEPGHFAYATIHLDEGSIGIAPVRALISPMYTVFGIDESRVAPEYLIRCLKSPWALAHFARLGKGAVHRRQAISLAALCSLSIPLPSIEEQRRIAMILDRADAIRTRRRLVLTHLDDLAPSLFGMMFNGLPWDVQLGEIAGVQIGPFGSLLHQDDYVTGGIPVLNPMHIRGGELHPDPEFSVSKAKAESLSNFRLAEDDILLGRRGEMGRAGMAGTEHVGMLCGTGSLVLRPRGVEPIFLHAVVTSLRMKRHLERSALGSTLPNLNVTIVKSAPAPLAPVKLQREFSEYVSRIWAQRATVARALAAGDTLFVALQSRAFRGEL